MFSEDMVDACCDDIAGNSLRSKLSGLCVSGAVWTPGLNDDEFSQDLCENLSGFLGSLFGDLNPPDFEGVFLACVLFMGHPLQEFPIMYEDVEPGLGGCEVVGCLLLKRCRPQIDGRVGIFLPFFVVNHPSPVSAREVLLFSACSGLRTLISSGMDSALSSDFFNAGCRLFLVIKHVLDQPLSLSSTAEMDQFLYFLNFQPAADNWKLIATSDEVFELETDLNRRSFQDGHLALS